MSTCPVIMMNHNMAMDSTPPASPSFHWLNKLPSNSLSCNGTTPLSPIRRLPTIVTHSTPPSSPTITKMLVLRSPPPNSGKNLPTFTVVTTTPPTPTATVSSNSRLQPVARSLSSSKSAKRKLGPGCGLVDWIRLCRSKTDIAGNRGEKRPITLEELAEHNTESDAWTAIRGKVYNLTYYMKFHPGGKEELMRGAGIDCTILFDEVHKWVNVESMLKFCCIGPLLASSPRTQRRRSSNIILTNLRHREDLGVPKTIITTEAKNMQAVSTAIRKSSMTLRNETQAATACEETDGHRQVSPDSPVKPLVGNVIIKKVSTTLQEAASPNGSIRLAVPPTRIRRSSEPHPRFDWVQSEKTVTIHIMTKNMGLKSSDVVLDVNRGIFEATLFINDWTFELRIGLAHGIVGSQVNINCGRVEISLKKEVQHVQWEGIGTFLDGHCKLLPKTKRGTKYHATQVESIRTVTHDTKLFTLRLPVGSYLNVPTGHHLSIKAQVDGESVERSYTPISALEASSSRHGHAPTHHQEGQTIELMVKLYKDGKMSRFLSRLEQGDEVIVSDSEGSFDAATKLKSASDIILIAAGSGFTPMVKILRDFLATELVSRQRISSASEAKGESGQDDQLAPELPPATNTTCDCDEVSPVKLPKTAKMLFANKQECDIMYREELDHLALATADRFKVTHILSGENVHWGGLKGRICSSLLRKSLPPVNPPNHQTTLVCVCGPDAFLANISNMLLDMELPDECIQCFQ